MTEQRGQALADDLLSQAARLKADLAHCEQHDWPRWLRTADGITREISELLRQASEARRAQA